jgi:deoxyribonuclease V
LIASVSDWPETPNDLVAAQVALGNAADDAEPWIGRSSPPLVVAGAFALGATARGISPDAVWAGAVATRAGEIVGNAVVRADHRPRYKPGLLALREGPLLERAVRSLNQDVDVLVVNATGRDHPRRAGLAVHLGAALGLPTIGVTDRTLVAKVYSEPGSSRGDAASILLDGRLVAMLVRTAEGARPVVVHAAWRTSAQTALSVVLEVTRRARTPEPIRQARRLVKMARALDERRLLRPREDPP